MLAHGQQKGPKGFNKGQLLTQEELELLTADNGEQNKESEEEKQLMSEWEQHMSDFIPEDINTIVIEPKQEVVTIHTFY